MVAGSFCIYQSVPAQGRQVEEAVSSHGNICLFTIAVYSQCERLWLSQEEHVPLPLTVCPVLLAVLDSSPCYHAVLPLIRHALGHFDCMPSTSMCVWQTSPSQERHLIPPRGLSLEPL